MTTTANDFLLGGASASAKFENVGDTIAGRITSTEVRQQTDLATGQPLTWDNGDPRMQLVVHLATDLRDDDDDDGNRAIYVKGSKAPGSKSLHDAVRSAVQAAGAKGLETGGTLTVNFVGEEPSKTRGFNPRKLYEATYKAPDKAAETGGFLGTAEAAQAAPAPAPAAPAAPQGGGEESPAAKAQQLIALGLDDAAIASATGLPAEAVAAIRATA